MIKHTLVHMRKQTAEGKTGGLPHHRIVIMTFADARHVLVSLTHPPNANYVIPFPLFLSLVCLCSWKIIWNHSQTAVNQLDTKP